MIPLLNMATCTKSMQQTWWPVTSTTIVTGSYYRKTTNINRTLVGNKIVDHSDVVGASPVGAAPTASSFST